MPNYDVLFPFFGAFIILLIMLAGLGMYFEFRDNEKRKHQRRLLTQVDHCSIGNAEIDNLNELFKTDWRSMCLEDLQKVLITACNLGLDDYAEMAAGRLVEVHQKNPRGEYLGQAILSLPAGRFPKLAEELWREAGRSDLQYILENRESAGFEIVERAEDMLKMLGT